LGGHPVLYIAGARVTINFWYFYFKAPHAFHLPLIIG